MNKFDLSHQKLDTASMGKIIPTALYQVYPNDDFRGNIETFVKSNPLIAPIMHRVNLETYAFYVPERLIWSDAEEFRTRGRNKDSTITVPRIKVTNDTAFNDMLKKYSLADHFGIPPITDASEIDGAHYFNALPFRAYQLIINEYFRNQDIQDDLTKMPEWKIDSADYDVSTQAKSDSLARLMDLATRNWHKDYFTAAKPTAAPNDGIDYFAQIQSINTPGLEIYKDTSKVYRQDGTQPATGSIASGSSNILRDAGNAEMRIENLLDPLGVDIRDIQRVSVLRQFFEKMVRAGHRLKDYLQVVWGANPLDSRLQRPEYIGGSTAAIRVSEVLNTTDAGVSPVGMRSGLMQTYDNDAQVSYKASEHGYIIVLTCITPRPIYVSGLDKIWKKFDHLEYLIPDLADLGREDLKYFEIAHQWDDTESENTGTFAYVERYASDKTKLDSVSGDFRDNYEHWHFGRAFTSRPAFNETFIKCVPKTSPWAVEIGEQFLLQIQHNMSVLRNAPYYPSLELK